MARSWQTWLAPMALALGVSLSCASLVRAQDTPAEAESTTSPPTDNPAVAETKAATDTEPSQKPDRAGGLFQHLDANSDGQIAAEEVSDRHARLFNRLLRKADSDQSGQLNEQEFRSGLQAQRDQFEAPRGPKKAASGEAKPAKRENKKPQQEAVSKAGNRQPNRRPADRARPNPARLFAHLDANGDGAISQQEFQQQRARMEGRGPRGPRPDGDRGPGPRPDGQRDARPRDTQQGNDAFRPGGPLAMVRVLDKNGDGTISGDELAAASESLKKLDRDGDGQLSRREVLPGPGRMAAWGGSGAQRSDFRRPGSPPANFQAPRGPDLGRSPADRQRPDAAQFMKRFDQNNDGAVTADEMAAKMDQAARPPQTRQNRSRPDAGKGNNRASAEVAAQRHRERFERLDKDQDGSISADEWKSMGKRSESERKPTKTDGEKSQ